MAKKKTASGGMNRTERVAGTIFFLVYLLVMPLMAARLFDLLEVVLDTTIGASLRNVLYYYTLFAVTVLLFHSYLAHTSSRFLDNLNRALSTMLLGLLVFYGANELLFPPLCLSPLLRALRAAARLERGDHAVGFWLSHFDAPVSRPRPCLCLGV